MTAFLIGGALLIGFCVAIQGLLNAGLQARIGLGPTMVFSTFLVLMTSMGLMLARKETLAFQWEGIPWYYLLGGAMTGFSIGLTGIWVYPRLGVTVTSGLVIGAQLLTAILLDHWGAFGIARQPITLVRLMGVLLIIAGVWLSFKTSA